MLLSRRGINAKFFSYRKPSFVVVVENAKKKTLLVFFAFLGDFFYELLRPF